MKTDTEAMPEYVTVNHASKLLGCSTSQVRRMIELGVFNTYTVSKYQVQFKGGLPLKVTAIKLADVLEHKEAKASAE